jgi:hypothetical protein
MQARVVSPSPGAARRRAGAQRYKRGVRGRGIRLRARLPGERSSKTPPVAIASREKRGAPTCPAALRLLLSPDNIWLLSYSPTVTGQPRDGGAAAAVRKKRNTRVVSRGVLVHMLICPAATCAPRPAGRCESTTEL